MSDGLAVGIIGCGYISETYLARAPLFRGLRVVACADAVPEAAEARARAHGIAARDVDALLADPSIDLVVNLTVPAAHFAISRAALEAGKHVYSEKPFTLDLADAQVLRGLAEAKGLSVGSAPDTFLGGAHQRARAALDAGEIGTPVSGTAHVMSHGMEDWHPNPAFFFQPGGGPVLDLGPYYVASLVSLIGPVRRVAALSSIGLPRRTITSEPRRGEQIVVGTPTTIHALLEFVGGATVTLSASWDVWAHRHGNMELYGTGGTLFIPDPNYFDGAVEIARGTEPAAPLSSWNHPFGVPNRTEKGRSFADYRSVGLADMARAILSGGDARCGLDRAIHVVEVLAAILESGRTGAFHTLSTTCARPDPLDPPAAAALLRS